LLRSLAAQSADFIPVGGAAAAAHGSTKSTQGIDVVYRRDEANHERIIAALEPHHPYLRGAPAGLPFRLDRETLRGGLNSRW
jgi:hypothetical protein